MRPARCASAFAFLFLGNSANAFRHVERFANSTTPPSTSGTASAYSETAGPFLGAYSYTWTRFITPTVVGTVHVTVDTAHNSTWSTTIYHTDYEANGTRKLLTRTDTDAGGTVTSTVKMANGVRMAITYPTTVLDPFSEFTWGAVLPITETGTYNEIRPYTRPTKTGLGTGGVVITDLGPEGTCCLSTQTLVQTPTHTPIPSLGPIDVADPSGWLYALVGWDYQNPLAQLNPSQVSSIWSPQLLELTYDACGHAYCTSSALAMAAPAGALESQAYLLSTTTTTLSAASSSKSSVAPESQPSSPTVSPTQSRSTPAPSPTSTQPPVPPTSSASEASPGSSRPQSVSENTSVSSLISIPPAESQQDSSRASELPEQPSRTSSQAGDTPATSSTTPSPAQSSQETSRPPSQSEQPATSSGDTRPAPPVSTPPESTAEPTPSTPVIVVGSSTITQQSNSDFVISSQTLAPGSTITLGEGSSTTEVALQTTGGKTIVQVGQSSSVLEAPPANAASSSPVSSTPTIVVGGVTVRPGSSSALVVGTQTLAPGSTITVGSGSSTTLVALQTSDSQTILRVGTVESTLPALPSSEPNVQATPVTVGGVTASPASSGAYEIGGETVQPGSSITLGSGASTTVVALQTSGGATILQVGTVESTLPAQPSSEAGAQATPVTLGGLTASPASLGAYEIGGETLQPGSSITLGSGSSTTVVALQTSGSATVLQVGTSHSTLPAPAPATASDVVFNGITLRPAPSSAFVVDGATLQPGSSVTVGAGPSGTVVALGTAGGETVLQVGTRSTTLAATGGDVGGYVASGLGGGGAEQPTGGAAPTGSGGQSVAPPGPSGGVTAGNAAPGRAGGAGGWHLALFEVGIAVGVLL